MSHTPLGANVSMKKKIPAHVCLVFWLMPLLFMLFRALVYCVVMARSSGVMRSACSGERLLVSEARFA